MRIMLVMLLLMLLLGCWSAAVAEIKGSTPGGFRPPATPLVTHDPYLSCWSFNDRLYDDWPKHWTGKPQAMGGIIRVDGKAMRFMGGGAQPEATVEQSTFPIVTATQTTYVFKCGPVDLAVVFTSPLLLDDLDIASRPVSYITFEARANDGKPHAVQLYFDATAEWAVNTPNQKVEWSMQSLQGLTVMRIGNAEQKLLNRAGDDVRIDWGYLLVAAPGDVPHKPAIGAVEQLRKEFIKSGEFKTLMDTKMPRAAEDRWPGAALAFDLGKVADKAERRHLMIGYDDLVAIEYFGKPLPAWWRRSPDASAEAMLAQAASDYTGLMAKCERFDKKLNEETTRAGGERYAQLCALAYRQAIAGGKIAAGPGDVPLFFPKECFSNGCIETVDVIYPASPFWLRYCTPLLKGQLSPIFEFARSDAWEFPFAPHDLGTYPKANGQVYGKGKIEGQMPVEESGNMLIMTSAICRAEQSTAFAEQYFDKLNLWAQYLVENGLDPANQLCTDDFAGHLARNVNLSAKALVALAAWADTCDAMGKKDLGEKYRKTAQDFVPKWMALADDGDHYTLAFEKKGTWSQKYNLVWDKLLGLKLFPKEVAQKEVAYYKTVQNRYGMPLDNRKDYTKLDWLVWSATLADNKEDFDALVAPTYLFMNETPSRVPLTDWYDTKTAKEIGFQARPVIGGVFIKLLEHGLTAGK
jgi:hypothetical protein